MNWNVIKSIKNQINELKWIAMNYLEVALVALAQFGTDHGLGSGHVVDGSLDGYDAFHVETADVTQTAIKLMNHYYYYYYTIKDDDHWIKPGKNWIVENWKKSLIELNLEKYLSWKK